MLVECRVCVAHGPPDFNLFDRTSSVSLASRPPTRPQPSFPYEVQAGHIPDPLVTGPNAPPRPVIFMTRHQWHRTAQALLHAAGSGRRALSSQPPGEPPVTWPLLRRKPSRQNSAQESGMGPDGHLADESAAVAIDETVRPNLRDPAGSLRGTGLSVCGLSPNLAASDFYRLAATELSKWQSTITKGSASPPDQRGSVLASH